MRSIAQTTTININTRCHANRGRSISANSCSVLPQTPVSPELLDALIAYLADGNEWAAERLAREPGWVLDAALRETSAAKVFAAHLGQVHGHELAGLRLGKKTEALYERAVELTRQLDRYSYGATVRFSDTEVDQARAAGVVIEFDRIGRCIGSSSSRRSPVPSTSSRSRSPSAPRRRRPTVGGRPASPRIPSPTPAARNNVSCASSQSGRTASTSISAPAC